MWYIEFDYTDWEKILRLKPQDDIRCSYSEKRSTPTVILSEAKNLDRLGILSKWIRLFEGGRAYDKRKNTEKAYQIRAVLLSVFILHGLYCLCRGVPGADA